MDAAELQRHADEQAATFQKRLTEWVADNQKKIDEYMAAHFPTLEREELIQDPGNKYVRIWKSRASERARDCRGSAFAFIVKANGDILKPATWKAPAKHARGNIYDVSKGMGRMNEYGPEYLR
jgi:hypothetical protein